MLSRLRPANVVSHFTRVRALASAAPGPSSPVAAAAQEALVPESDELMADTAALPKAIARLLRVATATSASSDPLALSLVALPSSTLIQQLLRLAPEADNYGVAAEHPDSLLEHLEGLDHSELAALLDAELERRAVLLRRELSMELRTGAIRSEKARLSGMKISFR